MILFKKNKSDKFVTTFFYQVKKLNKKKLPSAETQTLVLLITWKCWFINFQLLKNNGGARSRRANKEFAYSLFNKSKYVLQTLYFKRRTNQIRIQLKKKKKIERYFPKIEALTVERRILELKSPREN